MPYRELTVRTVGRTGGGYVPEQRRSLASRVLDLIGRVIRFEMTHIATTPQRWAMMIVGLLVLWFGAALDGSRLGNGLVAVGVGVLAVLHGWAWLHRRPPTLLPTYLDGLITDQTVPLLEVVHEAERVAVRSAVGAGGQDQPLRLEAPPRQDWPMLGIELVTTRQRHDQVVEAIVAASGVPGLAWIEDPTPLSGSCAQLGQHTFVYGRAWCLCGHQVRSSVF